MGKKPQRIVELVCETVHLPDGRRFDMEIVRHPGGACVAALDAEDRVCLLRQYRHVAGGYLWELPAGKRAAGEPPDETARRELREEAGVAAAQWRSLGEIYPSPGVFTEVVHLYLARGLTPLEGSPEPDECFEVHWVDFREALAWCGAGDICDAKTLVGLWRAAWVLRGTPLP